jgi:nitrous oxide reductase
MTLPPPAATCLSTITERIVMPSHDEERRSSGSSGRRLSRRSLLQGAATAGAAGLAVTAMGAATPALAATDRSSAVSLDPAKTPAGPIVVHVRDAKSGDIEVLSGTSETRLRDKDLAARIVRAIG